MEQWEHTHWKIPPRHNPLFIILKQILRDRIEDYNTK
jgi:hypothetical protein